MTHAPETGAVEIDSNFRSSVSGAYAMGIRLIGFLALNSRTDTVNNALQNAEERIA